MVNRQASGQHFRFHDIRFRIVKRKGNSLKTIRVTNTKQSSSLSNTKGFLIYQDRITFSWYSLPSSISSSVPNAFM